MLLAFLADLKEMFDSCGVREAETVTGLACSLSNGATEMYETYIANGMITDVPGSCLPWNSVSGHQRPHLTVLDRNRASGST